LRIILANMTPMVMAIVTIPPTIIVTVVVSVDDDDT
jgi:hypothetical protein